MAINIKAKFKEEANDIIPQTFILPQDYKELINNMYNNSVWILKPFAQSQGKGIILVSVNRLTKNPKFQIMLL